MNRTHRHLALLALAAVALTSCSAPPAEDADPTPAVRETSATPSPVAEPEPDETPASIPEGDVPAWAAGLSRAGTPVGEVTVDGMHVEFRYLDTFPADRAQEVSASEGNFTLYEAGDPIHHLNVVATNVTEETIVLGGGSDLTVSLFPEDWAYSTAPVGPTIPWDYKDEMGLTASSISEIADDHRYPVAPGETYSFTLSTHAATVEARVVWRDPGDWVNEHTGTVLLSFT